MARQLTANNQKMKYWSQEGSERPKSQTGKKR
jgi:hypothetical protein